MGIVAISRSLVAGLAVVGFAITACTRADSPVDQPLNITLAQFQQLRWLEGTWRGSGEGYDAFFERYQWVNDSTIQKVGFTDSTLAIATDSSALMLRGEHVRSESPARSWVVVALDSIAARFAPERNAANGFEWRRTGDGAWTARITWDSANVARERLYEMRAYTLPTATPR